MNRGIRTCLASFMDEWLEACRPPFHVQKVLSRLRSCRTEAMGGRIMACPECGAVHEMHYSCRDRHCPTCQARTREAWKEARQEELMPVTYFHVVFTIPDALNDVALRNKAAAYDALFSAAWRTLSEFGRKKYGVQMGMTSVLHTWGSTLVFHPHLHCIVPGGGVDDKGRWKPIPQVSGSNGKEPFLFPVMAMGDMFRASFMAALSASGVVVPAGIRRDCFRKAWVVYAKSPVCGPEKTLEYLARYAYRVAISDNRILSVSDVNVTFAYKDYGDGGTDKVMTLCGVEFVRRYSQHVLPTRFVRIRHFGFLAPGNRRKLRAAQEQLGVTPVRAGRRRKSWVVICQERGLVMDLCPDCRKGVMKVLSVIPRARSPETFLICHDA